MNQIKCTVFTVFILFIMASFLTHKEFKTIFKFPDSQDYVCLILNFSVSLSPLPLPFLIPPSPPPLSFPLFIFPLLPTLSFSEGHASFFLLPLLPPLSTISSPFLEFSSHLAILWSAFIIYVALKTFMEMSVLAWNVLSLKIFPG